MADATQDMTTQTSHEGIDDMDGFLNAPVSSETYISGRATEGDLRCFLPLSPFFTELRRWIFLQAPEKIEYKSYINQSIEVHLKPILDNLEDLDFSSIHRSYLTALGNKLTEFKSQQTNKIKNLLVKKDFYSLPTEKELAAIIMCKLPANGANGSVSLSSISKQTKLWYRAKIRKVLSRIDVDCPWFKTEPEDRRKTKEIYIPNPQDPIPFISSLLRIDSKIASQVKKLIKEQFKITAPIVRPMAFTSTPTITNTAREDLWESSEDEAVSTNPPLQQLAPTPTFNNSSFTTSLNNNNPSSSNSSNNDSSATTDYRDGSNDASSAINSLNSSSVTVDSLNNGSSAATDSRDGLNDASSTDGLNNNSLIDSSTTSNPLNSLNHISLSSNSSSLTDSLNNNPSTLDNGSSIMVNFLNSGLSSAATDPRNSLNNATSSTDALNNNSLIVSPASSTVTTPSSANISSHGTSSILPLPAILIPSSPFSVLSSLSQIQNPQTLILNSQAQPNKPYTKEVAMGYIFPKTCGVKRKSGTTQPEIKWDDMANMEKYLTSEAAKKIMTDLGLSVENKEKDRNKKGYIAAIIKAYENCQKDEKFLQELYQHSLKVKTVFGGPQKKQKQKNTNLPKGQNKKKKFFKQNKREVSSFAGELFTNQNHGIEGILKKYEEFLKMERDQGKRTDFTSYEKIMEPGSQERQDLIKAILLRSRPEEEQLRAAYDEVLCLFKID